MQLRQCKDKAKKPYTRAFQSCHKGKISCAQDRVEGPWEDRWIATFWMGDHPRWVIALAPKSTAQGRGSRFAGTETGSASLSTPCPSSSLTKYLTRRREFKCSLKHLSRVKLPRH